MFTIFGLLVGGLLFKGGLSATGSLHMAVKAKLQEQEDAIKASTLRNMLGASPDEPIIQDRLTFFRKGNVMATPEAVSRILEAKMQSGQPLSFGEAAAMEMFRQDIAFRAVSEGGSHE